MRSSQLLVALLAFAPACSAPWGLQSHDTAGMAMAPAEGPYLKASAGLLGSIDDDASVAGAGAIDPTPLDVDDPTTLGAAFGWATSGPWAYELEATYYEADASHSSELSWTSILLNAIYRIPTEGRLKPYIGAGVGFIPEVELDVEGLGGTGSYTSNGQFAFQLLGGLGFQVHQAIELYAEARTLQLSESDLDPDDGSTGTADGVDSAVMGLFGVKLRW